MEYFVPAWHGQLIDWAFNVPRIEIYDEISNMRLLRKGNRKIGLVLTDYQPQYLTKLNQIAFYPDELFSVFDYLQDVNTHESQTVDYLDLNWPQNIRFDFTPFKIMASVNNQLYANIIFDFNGKILNVEYFDENGQITKKLIFDTRGFISSVIIGDEEIYYDPMGHWRFKHNIKTDAVKINPIFHFTNKQEYAHLNELITEVMENQFLNKVTDDDHLIVTLDDQATVNLDVYKSYRTIFALNQYYPYKGDLSKIDDHYLIVDNREIALKIDPSVSYIVIPTFQAEFKLGHSQQLRKQIVGVFIEHTDYEDLKQIVFNLYPHLLNHATREEISFLYYDNKKENEINQVLAELKKAHPNEFELNRPQKDKVENQFEDENKLPNLIIKSQRLSSIADAIKILDKIRLLISWNSNDPFIQTAAVSVGIPQLQNFETLQLVNHKNGLICKDMSELAAGTNYYLDDLGNWNQALMFNVQLMNAYSAESMLKKWQTVLSDKKVL
ncbi:accessory Sec system protein Asp1 [Lactobacillus amylovorus]|uniref:accessory Sec system protein Asp1 n=1 Tax=Lactobacillus amylovorus TaxID=1604 RepID=UPI00232D3573|nr:accessory Sec system protein Asp1 [Lactobacillus amylovorus]MDB6230766.1 accessory Sec system protein Asp1 [Lactobacillus amylovorus]